MPVLLTIPWFVLLALQVPAEPADPSLLVLSEQYSEPLAGRLLARTWHGLFLLDATAERVAPIAIELGEPAIGCTEEDVIVDVRGEPSGAQYAVRSDVVQPGTITSVRLDYPVLLSGGNMLLSAGGAEEVSLPLGDRQYRLHLDGVREDLTDARVLLTDGRTDQALFTADGFVDEPYFTLHWAGDLDRDGRLDLLVTLSYKYSVFPTRECERNLVGN